MPWLLIDNEVYDPNFIALEEVVGVLDSHLARLDERFAGAEELVEQFDVYDSFDNFIGIGFAAFQVYVAGMSRELGLDKRDALGLGPVHTTGEPTIRLIHHAANLWKHADEWQDPPDPRAHRTLKGLEPLDLDIEEFPLVGALRGIVGSRSVHDLRLTPVLKQVAAWRDAAMRQTGHLKEGPDAGV